METIADRIVNRMNELKIKPKDLDDKKVASKGTISLWMSGGSTPTGDRLLRLAKELKTTEKWILSGDDIYSRIDESVTQIPLASVTCAPVLSWVQAGAWTRMEDIELTGNEETLPLVPGAGKRSFYLAVRGISNSPFYNEGEKICIDPDIKIDDIETGDMVVVRCLNIATFRALLRDENSIYLKALNDEWKPNITEFNEECVLVGKYMGSFKPPIKHTFN